MKSNNVNLLNIDVYTSTNSLLYLPVYIAKDLEILETVLKPALEHYDELKNREINVNFHSPKIGEEGDENAIIKMLEANKKCPNDVTIAITIGSPVAFLNSNKINKEDKDDIKVIGAVINKATFWAISKTPILGTEVKNISLVELGKNFNKVIYPNENFITGHYLGGKFKEEAKVKEACDKASFGEELTELRKNNKSIAITADIPKIATGEANESEYICYRFSEAEGDFLTTGIITSKKCCEKYPQVIEKIIESIQNSIEILYSSKKKAIESCVLLSNTLCKEQFVMPQDGDLSIEFDESSLVMKKIVNKMYKERFYPSIDLSVSEGSWNNAVEALKKIQDFSSNNADKEVTYAKYVDNSFVLRSLTKRSGIDLSTSKDKCKYDTGNCIRIVKHIGELKGTDKCISGWCCEHQEKYLERIKLIRINEFLRKHIKLWILLLSIVSFVVLISSKGLGEAITGVVAILGIAAKDKIKGFLEAIKNGSQNES
ncbi:MAG: hypothetical protein LBC85_10045 [Fibromonadaceae bacterium]|nr:hypothetical protein [Fibromonadaceae bacterium]